MHKRLQSLLLADLTLLVGVLVSRGIEWESVLIALTDPVDSLQRWVFLQSTLVAVLVIFSVFLAFYVFIVTLRRSGSQSVEETEFN